MPPLEALRVLLSVFVGHSRSSQRVMVFFDISRAHFNGVPLRRLFIESPDDERERAQMDGMDDC
eukprot:3177338-Amphidinium_carterae.1